MEYLNTIWQDDVLDGLKKIPEESVSLVFTSPPYNVNISYLSYDDHLSWEDYLNWLQEVWNQCCRILRPGGRLVINIDAVTAMGEEREREYTRPIYAELVNMMRKLDGMFFRADIVWYKHQLAGSPTCWGSFMSCSSPHIRRNHEYLLVWSRDQWKLPGDPELSDMTYEEFNEYTMSTWFVTPETKKPCDHPAPFPEELAKRVIKLYTYRGDVVLDPFCGSGTACAVAADLCRSYIGIDNDETYVKYAKQRASKALSSCFVDENNNDLSYVPRSKRVEQHNQNKSKTKKSNLLNTDRYQQCQSEEIF